jgi:hypothetical protein
MSTEQRLRDAFTALAATVDPDASSLPVPPARRRHRLLPALAASAVVLAAAGLLIFGRNEPRPTSPAVSTTATAPATSDTARIWVAYNLYTHCGIDEAVIGGTYFEAEVPIPEPLPANWGNPYQPGEMALLSPDRAVFRDEHGHEVRFRARPGATGFKHLCD